MISDFWTILFPETMKLSECEQQQQDGDDNGGHLSIQSSTPGKHSHIRSMWAPSIIVINTESTSPCSPGGSVMMTVFLPVHVSTMKQKEWQLKKAEIREATGRCIFTCYCCHSRHVGGLEHVETLMMYSLVWTFIGHMMRHSCCPHLEIPHWLLQATGRA